MDPIRPRALADVAAWDDEADVVVIGLGCAGACAAIEASEAGADVLVLERASGGGGTSAMSGGVVYLGGGTPVQSACGFEDTPEEMFKFLMASCGPDADEAKVRLYCDESVAHFEWFVAHGMPFKNGFSPEPGMEAATDDCLCYSGGEDAHPFPPIARPAPRAHKPKIPGRAGTYFMDLLLEAVGRTTARIAHDVRCDVLVVDAAGRVVGVVAKKDGHEYRVGAKRGVILAAGGFVLDDAMVGEYCPPVLRCEMRLSAGYDDGRGIRLGVGAGGAVKHMDAIECAVPITPPRRLVRGVLVNAQGQRFINEDTYFGRVGQESLLRQNGAMFMIVDTDVYEVNRAGNEVSWVGETIAELEQEMGLAAESLQKTIGSYNDHAARGEDPLFHKSPEFLKPLDEAPYGAIDFRIGSAIYATFTLGGLHTRTTGEVLTDSGAVVSGLYAAGRTTAGIAVGGYCSGISIGDGTFFGRLAGRSAAGA